MYQAKIALLLILDKCILQLNIGLVKAKDKQNPSVEFKREPSTRILHYNYNKNTSTKLLQRFQGYYNHKKLKTIRKKRKKQLKSELMLQSNINLRNNFCSKIPLQKLLEVTQQTTFTATNSNDKHSKLQNSASKRFHNIPQMPNIWQTNAFKTSVILLFSLRDYPNGRLNSVNYHS